MSKRPAAPGIGTPVRRLQRSMIGSVHHVKLVILLLTSVASLHPQELSRTTESIVIRKTEPQYTKEALAAKIEGDVVLSSYDRGRWCPIGQQTGSCPRNGTG